MNGVKSNHLKLFARNEKSFRVKRSSTRYRFLKTSHWFTFLYLGSFVAISPINTAGSYQLVQLNCRVWRHKSHVTPQGLHEILVLVCLYIRQHWTEKNLCTDSNISSTSCSSPRAYRWSSEGGCWRRRHPLQFEIWYFHINFLGKNAFELVKWTLTTVVSWEWPPPPPGKSTIAPPLEKIVSTPMRWYSFCFSGHIWLRYLAACTKNSSISNYAMLITARN